MEFDTHGRPKEHYEQRWLFAWINQRLGDYADLSTIYAIPNGGDRNQLVAKMMSLEGVQAGVCDIHVASARKGYPGLYIEMKKRHEGRVSAEQQQWINRLRFQGYRVEVCAGYEDARDVLIWYFDITELKPERKHWGEATNAVRREFGLTS